MRGRRGCRRLASVLLLAPLVLAGPLLLLAEAVVTLSRRGPLGWLLAAILVLAVLWSTRWLCRRTRAWWATTRAPVRPMRSRPEAPRR